MQQNHVSLGQKNLLPNRTRGQATLNGRLMNPTNTSALSNAVAPFEEQDIEPFLVVSVRGRGVVLCRLKAAGAAGFGRTLGEQDKL